MEKTRKNEYIYKFLKYLEENGDIHYSYIDKISNENGLFNDFEILDTIKEHDVIRSKTGYFEFDSIVYITEKGKKVLTFNSWSEYSETINKIKENIVKTNIRKETQEEIIRKGTIESFEYGKWGFVIAIASLILSILTLLLK
jgi:phosphorylcholine metabolism protein LicD